ncbi:MAG: hypothetical protein B6227_00810 [Fusobacteriia bacterium 4572_74]|nr:MAG: hypothetical protein B6227_00810 [Fusobacteriia bacterium 4572_74]
MLVFAYCAICFGKDPLPSLEGKIINIEEDNSFLVRIEREVWIPAETYRRLEFVSGKEPYINVGISTKIIPYYAKLKYLLNPEDKSSPYYLFSIGVNLVEGEDVAFNAFLDNISQRINYGIGVGVPFENIEIEILYGKYNYQNIGILQQEEKNLYSSTKITFGCKYRF